MTNQFNDEYKKDIAETIIEQTGGKKFLAMVGATNLSYGETQYGEYAQPYMMLKFKMNPTLKYYKVIYETGKDTYVVQFLNNRKKVVKEFQDVYCDDLVSIFEETTKLRTSLF